MASIFLGYLKWHFSDAIFNLFAIAGNYLRAANYKFLITRHFKTLFYPWHRQQPSDLVKNRTRNFFERILDAIIDFYIRILAAIVRLSVITTGLATQIFIILFFSALITSWILWPVFSLYLVFYGAILLF